MSDAYPTKDDEQRIINWPYDDRLPMMHFIESIWWMADWGWHWHTKVEGEQRIRVYEISTGGWSGNESLIAAMRDNVVFWSMCWQQSRRGGHYIFHVVEP